MSVWCPDVDVDLTDSEDEEFELMKKDYNGREALLFVVDANLYKTKEHFVEALDIIKGSFLSGLLINDKDVLGIVFANTEMSPDPFEPNCLENIFVPANCAVFLPLRQLTKPIVEHYLNFLTTAEEDFGDQYGIAGNVSGNFASMIRLCVNLFEKCGYSLNSSAIVYMTDKASPHAPHTQEYQMALQKARDLDGKEVEFKLVPMVDDFDYNLFYKEFLTLCRGVEIDSFQPPDAQNLREILADRKLRQDFHNRSLGHFTFSLGPSLSISAQYYNYYRKRIYPRKIKLLRKDNTLVKQKYVIVVRSQDPETLEITDEREVKTSEGWYEISLGQMPIRISAERVNRVRNLHQPGMMLLGFKPKSALPEILYYKPFQFMYPDDQRIVGSKRLYRGLWQRCLDRDMVAICLFMCKRKSHPRYVALVPVTAAEHASTSFRSLLSGDGFKIVYLPMAKHIRHIDFSDWNSIENTATDEGVQLFEKIIKKLRVRYQPNLINDPVLEVLQANLLALGLNVKTENGGVTEMPDAKTQDERIASLLPVFNELFGEDIAPAKKRAAKEPAEPRAASKVAKITDDDIKAYDYVEQLIENGSLSACNAVQLRNILDAHFGVKMPRNTNKLLLIERINELNAE